MSGTGSGVVGDGIVDTKEEAMALLDVIREEQDLETELEGARFRAAVKAIFASAKGTAHVPAYRAEINRHQDAIFAINAAARSARLPLAPFLRQAGPTSYIKA